jgi:putative ABC transport system permease protein
MMRTSGVASVALVSARDMQWRLARFVLAAVATGLVFGVALMMSGVSNSFSVEITNTLGALGDPTWVVPAGSPGPFTDPIPVPARNVVVIRHAPGITAADPMLVGRALATLETSSGTPSASPRNMNVLGIVPGGIGAPKVVVGRPVSGQDTTVLDTSTGARVGQRIVLNGIPFTVVGLVDGVTYFAGEPVAFVTLRAAQRLNSGSAPLATAFLTRGSPRGALPGFTVLAPAKVRQDLARPTAQASQTIKLIEGLLWLVAAGIIGAIVYLSALERRRDFAVLKAVGTPSTYVFAGLVMQALVLAIGAATVGVIAEIPMSKMSAMAVRPSTIDYVAVPIVALVVGVVASVFPARRAAQVDPAIAFGSGK